ncbi:MAG: protein kinase [Clostridiales bacterium]|jgi:hypothetical protein|nr:protein kinase [Clostridiales bacterium]
MTKKIEVNLDAFLDKTISDNEHEYKIIHHIASGAIGHMFYCRNEELVDDRAVKFIPYDSLQAGWENEIKKVNTLKGIGNVVAYHTNGKMMIDQVEYLYIVWDYVPSDSFASMIKQHTVGISLLLDVIRTILEILHACKYADVFHADLHAGNILIEKENPRYLDETRRKVWLTDFGRITQGDSKDFVDDFLGLYRVIQNALNSIDFHALDSENKRVFRVLKERFLRNLIETNALEDNTVRNPRNLLDFLQKVLNKEKEKQTISTEIGDYLAAEHLGDNFDEWRAIFVPKFIATNELIEKNICVLTGLRGCGKTMLFKRLSAYFNVMMGGPAALDGSDNFYGFYLSARDIAEIFPWLPMDLEETAREQLIHNFNLKWTLEILMWLQEFLKGKEYDISFLNSFFKNYFPKYSSGKAGATIFYLIELVKQEIEKSRLQTKYRTGSWPLIQYDYLEFFVRLLKNKIVLIDRNKPFYFFLDDYSLPMVRPTVQRILNPIIFRRSAEVIFKVSTESVESFVPMGLNNKTLEEGADYTLIDCGFITLTKTEKECRDILFDILQPRIERDKTLKNRKLTLEKLLGKTSLNNEERAVLIRNEQDEPSKKTTKTKVLYQGCEVFSNMWSSDIREMINLFADMVFKEDIERLKGHKFPLISDEIQNELYKETGGQFMTLLRSVTKPSENSTDVDKEHTYAEHLASIVRAFQEIASYELKTKKSKNQGSSPIKKVRRIEISNADHDLTPEAYEYYRGLIRYGIFIRDYRGKSVRGKIVPRLILRGRLIPYFGLTFSKHDSLMMTWEKFQRFLLDPRGYASDHIKGKPEKQDASYSDTGPSLFQFDGDGNVL